MIDRIRIQIGLNNIDWEQLFLLYQSVGLTVARGNLDSLRSAFQNSYKVAIACLDDKIIGAGRMVSDGIFYGTIFDVGILPDYQKQGIGKKIMNSLLNGEDKLCVHLTSTFGNEQFYQKIGFKKHKTAMAKYPYKSDYLED